MKLLSKLTLMSVLIVPVENKDDFLNLKLKVLFLLRSSIKSLIYIDWKIYTIHELYKNEFAYSLAIQLLLKKIDHIFYY